MNWYWINIDINIFQTSIFTRLFHFDLTQSEFFLPSRQQHTGKWRAFSYIFPSCLMAFIVNITRLVLQIQLFTPINFYLFRFLETEADRVCIDFSRCGKCAQEPYYKYVMLVEEHFIIVIIFLFSYRIRPTVMRLNKIYITYQSWSWILLTGAGAAISQTSQCRLSYLLQV